MKMMYDLLKKNAVITTGVLCASAGLLLSACERHDTSTPQGAADEAADKIRGAGRDASDKIRDAANDLNRTNRLNDAAKDAGRSLEKAGEDLKQQSK